MSRLRPLAVVLLWGVLAVLGAGAPAGRARADDVPSAVEQLTQQERAYLREHIRGWDTLDAAHRERIAKNVLRWRTLSPEERQRVLERIQALRSRRARDAASPARLPPLHDAHFRSELRRRGLAARAVGLVVVDGLSADAKAAIEKLETPRGQWAFDLGLFRRLWEQIGRSEAARGVPRPVLPDDAPDAWRRRVAEWTKAAESGDVEARAHLARVVVSTEMRALEKRIAGTDPKDEAALRTAAQEFQKLHPEAFAALDAELEKAAAEPQGLERFLRPPPGGGHGSRGAGSAQRHAQDLLRALDQAAPFLSRNPVLARRAEALRQALRAYLRTAHEPPR